MPVKLPSWGALAAAACLGAASWVSRGVLAVTAPWPDAPRIGLLPPLWQLVVSAALSAAAMALLRLTTRQTLPVWLTALALVPWLPLPAGWMAPALLIWAGPLTVLLWIVLAGMLAVGCLGRRPLRLPAWWREPARAPVLAGALALAIYGAAAWWTQPGRPDGDEPHYLVITQSLLQDGDLRIENNHRAQTYKAFFAGELKPDYLRRGRDGQIYSVHAPGVSVLVAPAFALAGYRGSVTFLAVVAALATALVWRTAYRVTGSAAGAWCGWAAVALSAPFLLHSYAVYPDAPAAALVMAAVGGLVGRPERGSPWRWVWRGAALAYLPWLHTRYAVIAGVLGACILARLARPSLVPRAAAFVSVPIASALAWLGYFYAIYGTPDPSAPYGRYTQTAARHIAAGLPGLLFDQQFGILPNAPVYALALIGLIGLLWSRPRPPLSHPLQPYRAMGVGILATTAAYLVAVSTYRMWWGGWSAPARFAVPVLLPLGIGAAAFWAEAQTRASRATVLAALAGSVAISAMLVAVDHGRLAFNTRDGYALWLEWASPLADLALGLPSLFRDSPAEALMRALVWAVAMAGAWAALRALERAGRADIDTLGLAAPAVFVMAGLIGLSAVWVMNRAPEVTATPAQLRLLGAYDPERLPVGVQFGPLRFLEAEAVPAQLEIASLSRRLPARDAPLALLTPVPAGRYRIGIQTRGAPAGLVSVLVGRSAGPIAAIEVGRGDAARDARVLDLAANVMALSFVGDEAARRSVSRLTLEPLRVVPPRERLAAGYASQAARYGAWTAYVFGDGAFVEDAGLWARPGREVDLILAPDSPRGALRISLRNAPVVNHVQLESGDWIADLTLSPGEERTFDVPIDTTHGAVRLRVRAASGFRPIDVEPGSRDGRYLGCRLEIR